MTEKLPNLVLSKKIWRIAPGEKAASWPEFREKGYIALGWRDIPDFKDFRSVDELNQFLKIRGGDGQNGAKRIWRFVWEIQPGDVVVANRGESQILGVGVVRSDYLPKTDTTNRMRSTGFPHARRVEWTTTQGVQLPKKFFGWRPPA